MPVKTIALASESINHFGQFDGDAMFVSGNASVNDGLGGFYYFLMNLSNDPALTPDGVNILQGLVIFSPNCRWVRPKYVLPIQQPTEVFETRTVNTPFRVSATRAARVKYAFTVPSSATLLAGSAIKMFLEQSPDATFNVPGNITVLDVDQFGIANGLVVTAYGTIKLEGRAAAGMYLRIRPEQIASIALATATLAAKQEILE